MKILSRAVVVGALGYFVDIYDLLLFTIVRVPSLKSLQVPEKDILDVGIWLLNLQMTGLLIGGILWGMLGDKKGRISVLFGSIFLYSLANLANSFVHTIEMYGLLRFLAGIGLAGELGAAITLVCEMLPKETRGYGTAIVAGVGLLGAVFAGIIGDLFSWRTAFLIGGILGFGLLILRINMLESQAFRTIATQKISKGNLLRLFRKKKDFIKYLCCIFIALPVWYVIGILVTLSPELSQKIGVQGSISGGKAIMFAYMGISIGDITSGVLSQYLRSRKKVVLLFLTATLILTLTYIFSNGLSVVAFYTLCAGLGFATGYWAVFVTIASEQFGTNIRATVTTTAPNFIRGSLVPLTLFFKALIPHVGLIHAALIVGLSTFIIGYFALHHLDETFGKDLNYTE